MYELATIGFENKQTAYINQILYWNFISVASDSPLSQSVSSNSNLTRLVGYK
jgi:hypothetical protein